MIFNFEHKMRLSIFYIGLVPFYVTSIKCTLAGENVLFLSLAFKTFLASIYMSNLISAIPTPNHADPCFHLSTFLFALNSSI